MAHPPVEYDADSEVIAFHDRMLAKGDVFYGIAVQPPKGKEDEVKGRLEEILTKNGYERGMVSMEAHLVFEGEFSPEAIEEVRVYLTSIEDQTPTMPRILRGNYFQMLAYKWFKRIIERSN
jgi:hypothetical protein